MKSLGTLMVNLLASVVMAFNPITGKVATVVDGNTLVVISEGDTYQVVLHDVDSPEPGQPYAEEARMHLEKILLNKNITVELTGKDRHGNYLGVVYIHASIDLRHELVQKGLAWASEKCSHPELLKLQERAQQAKAGLWSEDSPTPPWVFRRQQSMLTVKGS
ncbi:MAG: thermonuclease family protein [Cyclobacteriaceae bacterium]|nr:thermonuclease family protein [Cyclobacteriaceae bacterium]